MLKNEEEADAPGELTLVEKFSSSKAGWRKKPTTALRQERQLNTSLAEVAQRCGETDTSRLMRQHLDTMEQVLLEKVHDHPDLAKSLLVALLEFARYASVREPHEGASWDATIRQLDVWKGRPPAWTAIEKPTCRTEWATAPICHQKRNFLVYAPAFMQNLRT